MLKKLSALPQYSFNVLRENPQNQQIAQKRSSKAPGAAQSVSSAQSADDKCPATNGIIASDVRIERRTCCCSQGDAPFPKMFTAVVRSPDVRPDGRTTMKKRYQTNPSESVTVSTRPRRAGCRAQAPGATGGLPTSAGGGHGPRLRGHARSAWCHAQAQRGHVVQHKG